MSTRRYDGSNTTGLEGFARAMRAKRKAGAFKRPKPKPVMHYVHKRLYLNAGISFPACHADRDLLDMDKARLPSTTARALVDCKHCARIMAREVKS